MHGFSGLKTTLQHVAAHGLATQQINDTQRYQAATLFQAALNARATNLAKNFMTAMSGTKLDAMEKASIGGSFRSHAETIGKANTEAQEILDRAKSNGGKLSAEDAQKLQELGGKIGSTMDAMDVLLDQLRHNKKDDDDNGGATGTPSLMVSGHTQTNFSKAVLVGGD
jgi:hypothetical protein